MVSNIWLKDKFKDYWTFQIIGEDTSLITENKVKIDENPTMKVIESLEVEENGKKVWKPVLMIWESVEIIFTDKSILEDHNHIRLLEVNGDAVGILRHYDKSGEYLESWVMVGLNLLDINFKEDSLSAVFDFHHAVYL
jgi:hypothetical protein